MSFSLAGWIVTGIVICALVCALECRALKRNKEKFFKEGKLC